MEHNADKWSRSKMASLFLQHSNLTFDLTVVLLYGLRNPLLARSRRMSAETEYRLVLDEGALAYEPPCCITPRYPVASLSSWITRVPL
jgi:hypothetical protein